MKLLFDLLPIILFFCAYQIYGKLSTATVEALNYTPFLTLTPGKAEDAILFATAVAIVASLLQVSLYFLKQRRFEPMHLVTLALVVVLGGATIVFRDPIFIKWKPTLVNWLFGLAFLASQIFTRKPLVQRMMSTAITLPASLWKRLNLIWVVFFLASGIANLYVAYQFTEATWVNFKLFGMLGLTLLFVIGQALYLSRYLSSPED